MNFLFLALCLFAAFGMAVGLPFVIQRYWLKRAAPAVPVWLYCVGKQATIFGAAGFTLGFLLPLVFFPEVRHGPLFGLMVAGPGAMLIGAGVGSYRSFVYKAGRSARH